MVTTRIRCMLLFMSMNIGWLLIDQARGRDALTTRAKARASQCKAFLLEFSLKSESIVCSKFYQTDSKTMR